MDSAHDILRRWLAVERRAGQAPPGSAGRSPAAAERVLRELMLCLPDRGPRPGFADRVLAAADLRLAAAPAAWPLRWALRAVLVLCLSLTAAAVASLPQLAQLAVERISLAETVSGLARTLTAMVDFMAVLVAAGKLLAALYEALLVVLTAPPVAAGWLAAVVFTVLTLRWLVRLLSPLEEPAAERSSDYAHG